MQSQSDISPAATHYQPSPLETEQPSFARSLPRDWSVWLLPVASLMLALSAYGVYALPTDFDLLVPLRILVLLCVALLLFVWFRTRGLLSSASNNVVTYKRDGTPIIWNPTLPIGALFNLGLIFAGFGAFELWTSRLDSFDFAYTLWLPFTSIVTSTLLTFFASLLWLSRIPALDNLLHNRIINRWILLPILVVCLGLGSYSGAVLSPSIYTTSFASWPSTLELVTHAAAQFDKNARIRWVETERPYEPNAATLADLSDLSEIALEVRFYFSSPIGSNLEIKALDTDPPRIEAINYSAYSGSRKPDSTLTQTSIDALAAKLSYVRIGPRALYPATLDEALSFTNGEPVAPREQMTLLLDRDWQTQYGVPAGWNMVYYLQPDENANMPAGPTILILRVDGSTGRVIAHELVDKIPNSILAEPDRSP